MDSAPQPSPTKRKRRLRLGMVGGGRGGFIAEVHALGARVSNRYDVVAGALSSDPELAMESGADWYFEPDRTYTSYHEMAKSEAARPDGIDAVAITTPNHVHHDCCVAFLEAGIDVICARREVGGGVPRPCERCWFQSPLGGHEWTFGCSSPNVR